MDNHQRIVNAMQNSMKSQGGSAWIAKEALQKATGLSSEVLGDVLADMESDCVLQTSGSSGYLRNRFRLNAMGGQIMGNVCQPAPIDEQDRDAAESDQPDQASAISSVRSFSAMAGLMMANEKQRIKDVALVMSSRDLRKLPCLAVTNDLQKPLYKLRRRQAHDKLFNETGLDVKPLGSVEIFTMNGAAADKDDFASAALMAKRQALFLGDAATTTPSTESDGKFLRATVAERDADGKIVSVNLPKGGVAAPSEVRNIDNAGSLVILQLGRRVNAKMIMLTAEGAEALICALDFSGHRARKAGGELQSVTVRNDRHGLVVERSARIGCTDLGKVTVNGVKGGKAVVSQIESVQFAGPVLMLNLDRRVNARSITISQEAVTGLRQNLSAVIGAMD